MTEFLLRRFASGTDTQDMNRMRTAVGNLSGAVGICVNLLLFVGKLAAGLLSGSVSIMADAMNNLSDASGSIVTLVGFRLAGKPADVQHPYGHARFEYVSGLAVAAMIMLIGAELAQSSVAKIIHPQKVTMSGLTAGIMFGSVGAKMWLYHFNRKLGQRIQSKVLLATAADSRNDCITTAAVLLAAVVEQTLDLRVDGIMGLAVALFILWSGWGLAKETISPLLGESADPQLRQRILDHIQKDSRVLGYHDLMVHDYGPGRQYASLHVEMDYREDPLVCHEIIDRMEWECLQELGVHLVIHYDPVVTDNPELTSLKNRVAEQLYIRDWRLRLHDFRMVQGRQHLNLIFDVALPADYVGQEAGICRQIEEQLNREGPKTYHVKITFDLLDE